MKIQKGEGSPEVAAKLFNWWLPSDYTYKAPPLLPDLTTHTHTIEVEEEALLEV